MLLHAADSDLFQAMFEVAIDYQGHYQTGMRTERLLGYIMELAQFSASNNNRCSACAMY